MQDEDLRQADLSTLSVQEMNAAQKAELRRRYDIFVRTFGQPPQAEEEPVDKRPVQKWVPGMKVASK